MFELLTHGAGKIWHCERQRPNWLEVVALLTFYQRSWRRLSIMDPSNEITELLVAWSGGDKKALDELMHIVYEELRRLAHRQTKLT